MTTPKYKNIYYPLQLVRDALHICKTLCHLISLYSRVLLVFNEKSLKLLRILNLSGAIQIYVSVLITLVPKSSSGRISYNVFVYR